MIRGRRLVTKIRLLRWPCSGANIASRLSLSSTTSQDEQATKNHPSSFQLPFHTTNLGLDMIVDQLDVIESIRQLKEVDDAVQTLLDQAEVKNAKSDEPTIVDSMLFANRIFEENVGGESKELLACLALLAEVRCYVAEEAKDYTRCVESIDILRKDHRPPEPAGLFEFAGIAEAKAYWLSGDFAKAKEICETILGKHSKELDASARTGQAVSRLLQVECLDDIFSVRDPFRMVIKSLELYPSTALAAAHLNMGVAEAVFAETAKKFNDVEAPLDAAMRNWKQGLTVLKQSRTKSNEDSVARRVLEARLHTNMGWGMLNMPRFRDHVQEASTYASKGLEVYDKALSSNVAKEGIGRTLSLLATCYHKSGKAVTAEGLLQSALANRTRGPAAKIELRACFSRYADLCRDWEKRDSDAEKYQQKADETDKSLPGGWQGKSEIHSSLWFWTPSLFYYAD